MESIIVHFKITNWDRLRESLSSIACWMEETRWAYPDRVNPLLWLDEYDSVINEYEDDKVDQLVKVLGDLPTCSLGITLRRRQQNQACVAAEQLSLLLLERFVGVVDDGYSEMWTREEIAGGVIKKDSNFLNCYRVPEN